MGVGSWRRGGQEEADTLSSVINAASDPGAAGTPGGTPEKPAIFFRDGGEFRAWLEANHDTASELWMGMPKKHLDRPSVTWAEAVPEALCFGWIDSKSESIDEDHWRQRWTPRKAGSTWSRINIAHIERLTAEGRMHPAGLAAFAKRREDRTGTYSFEQESSELAPHHEQQLRADPAAAAFWDAATPGYRKTCAHWVASAKQEATRDKRLADLVSDSAAGRLVSFQRYGTPPAWLSRAAEAARVARIARVARDAGAHEAPDTGRPTGATP